MASTTALGIALRERAKGSRTLEAAARGIVRTLYDSLRAPDESRACVLVRTYLTRPVDALPKELRARLDEPHRADDGTRCLVLVGTVGVEPAWGDRKRSVDHAVIPLASEDAVRRLPMVARLVAQLGVSPSALVGDDPGPVLALSGRVLNAFFVREAAGSPYIPAQNEFVEPYVVKSVVGFGGVLTNGALFCTVAFTRVTMRRQTAELFRLLAEPVRQTFEPFLPDRVFD